MGKTRNTWTEWIIWKDGGSGDEGMDDEFEDLESGGESGDPEKEN